MPRARTPVRQRQPAPTPRWNWPPPAPQRRPPAWPEMPPHTFGASATTTALAACASAPTRTKASRSKRARRAGMASTISTPPTPAAASSAVKLPGTGARPAPWPPAAAAPSATTSAASATQCAGRAGLHPRVSAAHAAGPTRMAPHEALARQRTLRLLRTPAHDEPEGHQRQHRVSARTHQLRPRPRASRPPAMAGAHDARQVPWPGRSAQARRGSRSRDTIAGHDGRERGPAHGHGDAVQEGQQQQTGGADVPGTATPPPAPARSGAAHNCVAAK